MVTGASTADLAVILIDARKGVLTQTRRHSYLVSLLGIRRIVLAVNKMDLMEYSREAFARIEEDYREFAVRIGLDEITAIPISAVHGDNIVAPGGRMPWYAGPTLMQHLDYVPVGSDLDRKPFRMPVQWVNRPDSGGLELNDIGVCALELEQPVAFETYDENRDLGGFILIDRITNNTVGAGLLRFALRRSENVRWETLDVTRRARAGLKGQKPCVLWFTGLSGAGKSTIANLTEKRLHALGRHTYILDGDNVRHGLNKDLGFTDADRVENIRRVAEVAHLMADAGLIVIVSFISPFRAERRMARRLMEDGEFIEVFVDAPLAIAEARDPKGLYRKARAGQLPNFTGIDSPYEPPETPEIHLETSRLSPEEAVEMVFEHLRRSGMIQA